MTLRYKTKTKRDEKLNFAGVVDYVTSNILSKFESPILISSEVMGVCHDRDITLLNEN